MPVEQQQVDNRNAHSEYNETDQVCEPHAVGICVDGRAIEEVRYTKDGGPECGWADSQGLAAAYRHEREEGSGVLWRRHGRGDHRSPDQNSRSYGDRPY